MTLKNSDSKYLVLVAEDDPDDRYLVNEAFKRAKIPAELVCVENGKAVIDYLQAASQKSESDDIPQIILLDLNMPLLDGRDTLKIIKNDPLLKKIPVVVLTTSANEDDVKLAYQVGANSFVTKPREFKEFESVIDVLSQYWLKVVKLPLVEKNKQ